MTATARTFLEYQDARQDITKNLLSLRFESGLNEDELLLQHLRYQSHAHTVQVCASSAFLISILNEVRQIRADLSKTSKQRRAIQLLTADSLPKDPLKVGIIGCGRLGSHLAQSLLSFSDVAPQDLAISSRRPEALRDFQDKGCHVVFNNREVTSMSHVLFICVPPSQLSEVAEEIKDYMNSQTLVYCLVNKAIAKKLKIIFNTPYIIAPHFVFDASTATQWNINCSIHDTLENIETIENCCPLSDKGREACVHLTEKWVELVICALVNMCSDLELTSDAALDMVHGVVMGMERLDESGSHIFHQSDFIINWKNQGENPKRFPKFDLCKIHDNDSHVLKKLKSSQVLQKSFTKKFSHVFQSYHELKRYNPGENEKQNDKH